MTTSSIFHFLARLMERRGYFVQDNDLQDFTFPAYMIAAKSDGGFPDFVLRTNSDDKLVGGEFVELKDAKGYRISPFNSTIPTATKLVSSLSMVMQKQLVVVGEDLDFLPQRDVFYLIRSIKPSTSSPLAKSILVGGAFFETMPPNEVLAAAFDQVAAASMSGDMEVSELTKRFDVRQANFAGTRQVEGASISVRFRVMTQAAPAANLLSDNQYPMISDNTLTMLVHEPRLTSDTLLSRVYPWEQAPSAIRECAAYVHLAQAYDEIDATLEAVTDASVLRHLLNGPFFMAQAPIHPS